MKMSRSILHSLKAKTPNSDILIIAETVNGPFWVTEFDQEAVTQATGHDAITADNIDAIIKTLTGQGMKVAYARPN